MKRFTILVAKCAALMLRLVHRGGSFPGQLALRLCPQLFSVFHYTCPIILVTGTNGKTSTSNMISDLFVASGKNVVTNRKGDNLKEGIATALLNAATLSGDIRSDVMVLEVDELNIPYIMAHLHVTALVITNFFRDQLDRSQEMEQLIHKIEGAVENYGGTLVLNGNDPNVVRIKDHAPYAKAIFFGVDSCSASSETTTEASEGKFCPRCSEPLSYTFYQYSHIGVFHCTKCDFETPDLTYIAHNIDIAQGTFEVQDEPYRSPINSLYTIYNCMAVIAIAQLHHIKIDVVKRVFAQTKQPAGRNETFTYQSLNYTLNLVKNPTGANEVLKTIELDQENKALMIILNDNAQDGTDVSWIYDAQFERVLALSTPQIICSGKRAYDMALRIKYANYPGAIEVIEDPKEALDHLYQYKIKGYVIATYTALAPIRALMRKDGH